MQHKYGKKFKVCPQFERKCAGTHAGKNKQKSKQNVLVHQIIDQIQTQTVYNSDDSGSCDLDFRMHSHTIV